MFEELLEFNCDSREGRLLLMISLIFPSLILIISSPYFDAYSSSCETTKTRILELNF